MVAFLASPPTPSRSGSPSGMFQNYAFLHCKIAIFEKIAQYIVKAHIFDDAHHVARELTRRAAEPQTLRS